MNLTELIDAAKTKVGTLGQLAEKLDISPSRISDWKKGSYKPSATVIALLAEIAELPVLETLAEVEAQLHPEVSAVWQRALGKLRATSVTATVMLGTTTALALVMDNAQALCIM